MSRRRLPLALLLLLGARAAHADEPPEAAPATGEQEPAPPAEPPAEPAPEPAAEPAPVVAPAPTPASEPAPAPAGEAMSPELGFHFGSYGRVVVGTDLDGSTPEPVSVVAHPPRIVENTYVELDLRTGLRTGAGLTRIVITPAFFGEPFHYTGDLAKNDIVLRNLYAEWEHDDLALWVGSRMARGDDVYLLDWWPLDNLNLLGGGVRWQMDRLGLRAHAGANRLLDPFQHQLIDVPAPLFGAQTIEQLDRQRLVAALRADYLVLGEPGGGGFGLKTSVYAEVQGLPSGTRELDDETTEALPRDFGLVLGGELGAFGFGAQERGHANLFFRWGQGLAATDWLAVPASVGVDLRTWSRASELVFGVSANWEASRFGVQAGGYTRRFTSAAPDASTDPWSGWEAVLDVRPWVQLDGPVQAALDVSLQQRWPWGLSPTTLGPTQPTIWQIAPMLLVTPGGPGSYARPQLRLFWRAAHLDAGALDQYPLDDPRRSDTWVHFVGVQAEWWFNSSYQ